MRLARERRLAISEAGKAPAWAAHVLPPGATAAEGALDLIAIPAAVCLLDGAAARVEYANTGFAALGVSAAFDGGAQAQGLNARVAAFLSGKAARESFGWRTGDAVE